MKKPLLHLLATAAIGLNTATASATTISGDWVGNWSGSGITATFDMTIGPQDSLGRFNGSFDWACTSGVTCSGIENFTGGLGFGDSFAFWTTSFVNPVNLTSSFYWGNIIDEGNTLVGFDQGPRDTWSATRVQAVPEPGTLALMSLGLLAIGLSVKRKLPAANHLKTR